MSLACRRKSRYRFQPLNKDIAMNEHSKLSNRRRWAAVGVAAAVIATTAAMLGLSSHAEAPAAQAAAPAVPVSAAQVLQQDVTLWNEFSGRLEAVQRVDVQPRVSGAVQAVHFKEGALVKAGDLLFTVDPAPYVAEVDRAEAQVVAAKAHMAYTQSESERATRLWDERAIAQKEYDERVNARREADANLRAAQAALQTAKLNLGYTQVKAPVSGRVGRIEVTVGNLVSSGAGAPVLTTLVSVDPMYASFDADEQIVAQALQGLQSASQGRSTRALIETIPVQMGVGTSGGTPYAGHLQLIDNQVDAKSGTVRVRAVFGNVDGTLMAGQFARIRMGQPQTTQADPRAAGADDRRPAAQALTTRPSTGRCNLAHRWTACAWSLRASRPASASSSTDCSVCAPA